MIDKPNNAFNAWWIVNGITAQPPVMELAFRELAEKAWNAAISEAKERCIVIAMNHQRNNGTYAAGKKAGALECADSVSKTLDA